MDDRLPISHGLFDDGGTATKKTVLKLHSHAWTPAAIAKATGLSLTAVRAIIAAAPSKPRAKRIG